MGATRCRPPTMPRQQCPGWRGSSRSWTQLCRRRASGSRPPPSCAASAASRTAGSWASCSGTANAGEPPSWMLLEPCRLQYLRIWMLLEPYRLQCLRIRSGTHDPPPCTAGCTYAFASPQCCDPQTSNHMCMDMYCCSPHEVAVHGEKLLVCWHWCPAGVREPRALPCLVGASSKSHLHPSRPLSTLLSYVISRSDGDLSACVRTTGVLTDIELLPQGKNVIPSLARAHFNFRLLPGVTTAPFLPLAECLPLCRKL